MSKFKLKVRTYLITYEDGEHIARDMVSDDIRNNECLIELHKEILLLKSLQK